MKKIMFNDKYGLTQAVLEGRKTQTRRVIKMPQYDIEYLDEAFDWDFRESVIIDRYAKYKVGDIVAVAQSYRELGYTKLDIDTECIKKAGLYNKMFVRGDLMPHQIRITNVRIERLQEISDNDCLAEGIIKIISEDGTPRYYVKNLKGDTLFVTYTPQRAYAFLIDKVNGKCTWGSNPYVFVYDFKLLK